MEILRHKGPVIHKFGNNETKRLLGTGKSADFASGFFNIGGYALVRDKLKGGFRVYL